MATTTMKKKRAADLVKGDVVTFPVTHAFGARPEVVTSIEDGGRGYVLIRTEENGFPRGRVRLVDTMIDVAETT